MKFKNTYFLRYSLVIGFLFCLLSPILAQSSAELKKQRERLDQEIRQLTLSLQNTSKDRALSLQQVNALQTQLKLREQKISTINSEIRLLDNQIVSHRNSIREFENQLVQMRKDYEQMVRFAHRNRNSYSKMMFIFASHDFNQAFKRVKFLQQINESRQLKGKEIQATQTKIAQQVAQLEASRLEKEALRKEQEGERKEISNESGEESRVLKTLTAQESKFKQQLNQRQQEYNRLTRAMDAAIKRELDEARKKAEEERLAAAKAEAARTGKTIEEVEKENPDLRKKSDAELLMPTPEAKKLSADFASNRGNLPWPVKNGIITEKFGKQRVGINVDKEISGIRIRTYENMAVTAVFDGEVRSVLPMPGLGMTVLVRHGKFFTVYGNVKDVKVKSGEKIKVGQVLGTVITDSESTSELYFELIEEFERKDPQIWLAR